VTGIITDTAAVAALLHRHGALSFWDVAAAAPYVGISMTAPDGADPLSYKDAIFASPHKMIGGPGTPGLLVARKELFTNRVPAVPGGGTVSFVNPDDHRYIDDIEHREEAGTPNIIGSIRAGLAFALKESIGTDTIRQRGESFIKRAIESWSAKPNIEILGNPESDRLSIVSFVIRHGERRIHHNFVVALLNDLFGIQSRGGCSCAGPYGHRLLGIDVETSRGYDREIARGCEGIRPGWVRVNFNYFMSEQVFEFVLRAVHLVADEGWRMLPQYDFDPITGLWTHTGRTGAPQLSLDDISFTAEGIEHSEHRKTEGEDALVGYLTVGEQTLLAAQPNENEPKRPELTADFEHLRWFHLPDEMQRELLGQ